MRNFGESMSDFRAKVSEKLKDDAKKENTIAKKSALPFSNQKKRFGEGMFPSGLRNKKWYKFLVMKN